jgi:hypothetical protein
MVKGSKVKWGRGYISLKEIMRVRDEVCDKKRESHISGRNNTICERKRGRSRG